MDVSVSFANDETWQRKFWYESLESLDFPYNKDSGILDLREKHSDKTLFFDLITFTIIQSSLISNLYPPRDVKQARALIDEIRSCQVEELHRFCCLYYLAKDWNVDMQYAQQNLLPLNYKMLIDAYWLLDRFQLSSALKLLSHPSVFPNFPEKIIRTFQNTTDKKASIQFITRFIEVVQPKITDEKLMIDHFEALIAINPHYAYLQQRKYSSNLREIFFNKFVSSLMQQVNDPELKSNAMLLIYLPFDEFESQLLYKAAENSKGLLRELVITRLLQFSDLKAASKLLDYYRIGNNAEKASEVINHLKNIVISR